MTDIAKEAAKLNGHDFAAIGGRSNNNITSNNNNNSNNITTTNNNNNNNNEQQQSSARLVASSATNFEFRPSSKESGKNSKTTRSKSPGAFIERLSSFARGKYRSSLSERPTQSKNFGERPRRVSSFSIFFF